MKKGRIKNSGGMEEIENIKDFNFFHLYLVRRLKKWKDEKTFLLD